MKFGDDYRDIGSPSPQITLRPSEAADLLSLSEDAFRKHVMPHLSTVQVGRITLIPRDELERWVGDNLFRRRGI